MTTQVNAKPIDRARIAELTEIEQQKLDDRTQASRAMYAQASEHLSGGVASSYQGRVPWPIYIDRGEGDKIWDVDGTEYYDFHNGFGSMVQGHAHPAIGAAVAARYPLGTHFGCAVSDSYVVANELAKRWGCPSGASPTPARSPRWTPFGSLALSPAATP